MTVICVATPEARDLLGPLPGGIEVVVWDGVEARAAELDAVEMLIPAYTENPMSADTVRGLRSLRVVQLLSAGVEPWLNRVPAGVTLCSGRGIHGGSTAELAVAGMLSSLRDLPRFFAAQREGRWDRAFTDGLDGKRVLIVGAGDIGSRVAASIRPLGADVTLVARRPRDGVRTTDELPSLLPNHDVVVMAVPRTAETVGLVDAAFLAAMPDGALLVNIARGAIVDTDALTAELMSRRLHAFLDVTDPEPLPPEHPLWKAPNLLLTPHIGGGTRGWQQRAYRLVREQAIRLHDGEPLLNVVSDGY